MFDFWKAELTEEERDALLDKAAYEIKRRKLNAPAIIALELHKPLANVGAHAALATAPFLVPIFGYQFVNDYSRLFSSKENIEMLISMLEADRGRPAVSTEDSCPT